MTDDPPDEPRTIFTPGDAGIDDARTVFQPAVPARPSGRIKPGDVLNHMVEVRRFLARGGMGEVYEGANLVTDERVAIKVMLPALADDPGVATLFRREAQMLTGLHHEAVVQYRVVAVEPVLGVTYIVTEFIDGASLSDVLGKLHPDAAALTGLLRRLAAGLAAAHRLGAVHRDVSPDNVLLGGGELARAKLIDFGIAKDLDPGTATVVGDGFAGKLGYVAPEQIGDYGRNLGPWTDVYSLGLVILAVARGRDLGLGGTLVDAVDKRRAGLDTAAVPAPLRAIVDRMVRPDPADRLQSMDAVLAALDTGTTPGDSIARRPAPWMAAAAAAALLLLALVAWVAWPSASGTDATNRIADQRGDPVARTREAVDAALPSVSCTWLRLVEVRAGAGGPRVVLTGVAGDPAAAQGEIARTLQAQGLAIGGIDSAEVSPIRQAGCAALDAFRQIRSDGRNRLSVRQRRFEMQMQGPGRQYAGRLAANAVVGISVEDPTLDFALIGLEPSGKIDMVLPSRKDFAAALQASRQGTPITDLGGDRFRMEIDLDHAGWSGLMLVTGKGPFDSATLTPKLGERDSAWRDRLVSLSSERGWQADMIWFQSVDAVADGADRR